jgi:micrococcal nuclease
MWKPRAVLGSRMPSLGAVLLLIVAVAVLLLGGDDEDRGRSAPASSPQGDHVSGLVTRVVDGDTVEVELPGGSEDVRYIGIDTPESVAPGQPVECFGKRASEVNDRLVEGERVRLVFDDERRDKYGRLLAYVHAGPLFVNAELVRRGYARTLAIEPNTNRAELFDRLEQEAANAGRGLWAECGP